MKYGKLIEIQKKAHKYGVIASIAIGIMAALMCYCVFCLWKEIVNLIMLGIIAVVTFVVVAVYLVFTNLKGKQNRYAEDYFAIRIMDVLNEQGIETGNFELIQQTQFSYRVGFHNQIIDYEKLQAVIDKEVDAMNKIMKSNMRVKLI